MYYSRNELSIISDRIVKALQAGRTGFRCRGPPPRGNPNRPCLILRLALVVEHKNQLANSGLLDFGLHLVHREF